MGNPPVPAPKTRHPAADCARWNIRFNELRLGFVDTPFTAGFEMQMGGRGSFQSHAAGSTPMTRRGTAEEIADGIVFPASERSSFMTGSIFVIDGGECR